ncbi:MAG: hypothetical protein CMG00_03245 [Candidatus Marinimicrobia bacterium]|nr:hypothetical protein [Candidatus Neomarinimicrobiota bacterium]|tara:strand:+ start:808 stop:1848 length:1041 start_codon:yes stop_codon:yes gene_type:complete
MNKVIIIICSSVVICSIPLKNRYLVPVYLRIGLSTGYHDNVFQFSSREKNDIDSYNYMGDASNYDSFYLKPDFRILYSPKIFNQKITNFIFNASFSNFLNVEDKNSFNYSVRFEYKIKSFNWIKISYRNSPNNFLRYYNDNDLPEQKYFLCDYNSDSFYVSYSAAFGKYGWSRFKLYVANQFYNPNFTEFDTRHSKISFKHYFKFRGYKLNASFSYLLADNVSYDSGQLSSEFDRSYTGNIISFEIKDDLKNKFLDKILLGYTYSERFYKSESSFDPLHSGRSHSEHVVSLEIRKKIREDVQLGLKYQARNRNTISDFEWVESLKSFNGNQILFKIIYDMDIDTFY